MKVKSLLVLVAVACLSLLSSCIDEVDFGQFENVTANPTYEASILYLEAPESAINQAGGTNVFSQNYNFEAFSSDVFASRVLDGTITYIVENTTSKELVLTIEFLDEGGAVLDTEIISISEGPTGIIQREIAYGPSGESIEIIKSLSSIRVTGENKGDDSSTSNLDNPMMTLKSSGKFRVELVK